MNRAQFKNLKEFTTCDEWQNKFYICAWDGEYYRSNNIRIAEFLIITDKKTGLPTIKRCKDFEPCLRGGWGSGYQPIKPKDMPDWVREGYKRLKELP